ncbi:adenosylcobinamide-GDP ribazoletransferase [Symbioplanes lichenis]|uniref:adenosylcobinamide-GDP ribazoletransferase n=1 Tax=Symbioplanes lichenis TaxID=1629072 RepID=UPI00273845C4|nr:adenosylcobinamide-GDP ribazoletransferase [Actinoplanes lichenis]
MSDALRLAFTTLTVLPLRGGRIDRTVAAGAMTLAPLVGALLGLVLAGVHELLPAGLLGAAVTVTLGVLLTRGLHLDGLADTLDALGSYRRGEAALEIMKKSDIGPFGVAGIVLTLLLQTAAVAQLGPWAIVAAWTTGRLAVTLICRRGVPAARADGLGALVAGTVAPWRVALMLLLTMAVAVPAVPAFPWLGPLFVALTALAIVVQLRRAVARFGGMTGDLIGAGVELATTLMLVALALAAQ